MSQPFSTRTPPAARLKARKHQEQARKRERADRYDFLTKADHECGLRPECSREYDPQPDPACVLTHPLDYIGTGIGLLFGLGGECHAWQLAGWNVTRKGTT